MSDRLHSRRLPSGLSSAWFVARKDVQYMMRRWETLLWLFLMPVVFFYFIGTVTSGFAGGGGQPDRLVVDVPDDAGFLGDRLISRLEQRGFAVEPPDGSPTAEPPGRRLMIPSGFTTAVLSGQITEVELTLDGGDLGGEFDEIRVQRAVYTVLADLATAATRTPDGAALDAAAMGWLDEVPPTLSLKVRPAGEKREIPSGFDQAVPGTMVMFTLLILLTNGTVLLVIERRQGLLRRLASAPISRGSLVLGKWGARMILGLVQIGFAMFVGRYLFGTHWGSSLPMVLVVLVAWASLAASLALVLGSMARTEGQAAGLGVLVGNVLAALGGCWWPIEVTPGWMQTLAGFLPTGITMDAMRRLVNFGLPAGSATAHVVVLVLMSLAAGWVAARVFRYQ